MIHVFTYDFLDNSSTISISYTVYKYMQYIIYIQDIYTQYIYVYRIRCTNPFWLPILLGVPCLDAGPEDKQQQRDGELALIG